MTHVKTACLLLFFCIAVICIAKAYKHISYRLWYQDLVQETVTGMVKPEYLK